MASSEIDVAIEAELDDLLNKVARQRGKDPADLSGELIREKLRETTSPNGNRGKVQPFRRRP